MLPRSSIFLIGLLLTFCHWESLVRAATFEESAKAEGEVVLYSSLNNEQIVTLVDAFKKKYPYIKPSFYRGTSERVLQRANTEAKAGRFAVDVVTSAGFQVQLMKESGLTQRFVPPEAAAYDDDSKIPKVTGSAFIRCSTRWRITLNWCGPAKHQRDTKICWRRAGKAGSGSMSKIRNGT